MARIKHRDNALRRYLAEHSMSQAEFARRVGITPQAVHQYLSGKRRPRHDIALGISRATGLAVESVLYSDKELGAHK